MGALELILIKHAAPEIRGDRPASAWHLSDAGRRSCADLAARLFADPPRQLISSDEPKAVETAREVARRLQIGCATAPGLGEHRRESVPLLASEAEFRAAVEPMFAKPGLRVFGDETAGEAADRFCAAVDRVIDGWSGPGPIAIVAHGTVIALLVERWTGRSALETWRELGLPSLVRIALDRRALIEVCGDLGPPVDDVALLEYYLDRGAEPWNTSARCSGVGYRQSQWLEARELAPSAIANLGIGEGSWDDYLGHQFPRAAITSVDIDAEICALLRARQRREGHPNPSAVICADLLTAPLAGRFDLVTMVGSTAAETGDPDSAIAAAIAALRPGGLLYITSFEPIESIEGAAVERADDPELGLYAAFARRR